jgi:hypothetical protein
MARVREEMPDWIWDSDRTAAFLSFRGMSVAIRQTVHLYGKQKLMGASTSLLLYVQLTEEPTLDLCRNQSVDRSPMGCNLLDEP